MGKKYHWWILLLLCAVAVMSLACSQGGDDDDDDDDDDTAGDDDDDDNDDDDDDDMNQTTCEAVCAMYDECNGEEKGACETQCEAIEDAAINECLDYAAANATSCSRFDSYWDLCFNLDEIGDDWGDRMANFTLPDKDGNEVSLYEHVGKVIIVNFSAGWCPYCKQETRVLQELYEDYEDDGFIVLQLMAQDYTQGAPDAEFLESWVNLYSATFPVLGDSGAVVYSIYSNEPPGYLALPFSLLVQPNLEIYSEKAGWHESEEDYYRGKIEDWTE